MQGRYTDGRRARSLEVEVAVRPDGLAFEAGSGVNNWSFEHLRTERLSDEVRLSHPAGGDARLLVQATDWRGIGASAAGTLKRHGQWRQLRLVLGLAAFGVSAAAVVFLGIPAASGPMARATPPGVEQRIGRNFEAQFALAFRPCAAGPGQAALDRLGHRLQSAADTPFDIRVQAVQAPIANAFALPGGAVMVTGDLIEMAQTPDELSAVIAHEAAHVERRHVMQAVWRSLGFGMLLEAVVGGGSGAGQQAVLLAGSAANLRYSRRAEAEADVRGMELLRTLGLSSRGLAPFFRRLAHDNAGPQSSAVRELISSHPDSLRRARDADRHARSGAVAFTPTEWSAIKSACVKPRSKTKRLFPFELGSMLADDAGPDRSPEGRLRALDAQPAND